MSEAVWIELIRILPAFLWIGFAAIALVVARQLLHSQVHRVTKVETPFVSLDFAQELIEEAQRHPQAANGSAPDQVVETPNDTGVDIPNPRHRPGSGALDAKPSQQSIILSDSDRAQRDRTAGRLAYSADLLRGARILWVDDNPQWNQPLINLFSAAGMVVGTSRTTDGGLRELASRHYDVVITDMNRETEDPPESAGPRLIEEMARRHISVPVIVYSSAASARKLAHPRVVISTSHPTEVIDYVIDLVLRQRSSPAEAPRLLWSR